MRPRTPGAPLTPLIASLTLAGVLLACPEAARAAFVDASNTLPGTMCRKVGSSGSLVVTSDGAIYNDVAAGNPGLTVECPAPSAGQGMKTFNGTTVTYLDNSPSEITCTLLSEDATSGVLDNFTQGSTRDDKVYGTMSFVGVQGFVEGRFHFRCTIPARDSDGNASFLIGYHLNDDPINDPLGHLGYHTMPGVACRQVSGGTPVLSSDGSIYNNSSSATPLQVDCPVVASRSGDVSLAKTKIWYIDSSPSALSCTYAAEAADSTAVSQITQSSTVDDNNIHSFAFSGSKAITSFTDGFVHVKCSIPGVDSGGALSHINQYALEIN